MVEIARPRASRKARPVKTSSRPTRCEASCTPARVCTGPDQTSALETALVSRVKQLQRKGAQLQRHSLQSGGEAGIRQMRFVIEHSAGLSTSA